MSFLRACLYSIALKEKKSAFLAFSKCMQNQRKDIDAAFAGDIVACVGFKTPGTGDTLCEPDKKLLLEKMEFPEPDFNGH